MSKQLRIPSSVSAVPESEDVLRLVFREKQIGSVSATSLGDLLRLNLGSVSIVARGDVLSPGYRRGLATDVRLGYSARLTDRTDLLRLFSDIAVAWDVHRSPSTWSVAP